jgi:formylglycine-generating enzyme required for sulfatase activity
VGLVPLGPDPSSGLWEFGHHGPSGDLPERDPATGRLLFEAASGLVLVLIPGGMYWQGAQATNPSGPNYDRDVSKKELHEGPPRQVTLAPFFLSKFELTQAQWEHVQGTNPSQFEVGSEFNDVVTSSLHPVEFVSWEEALAFARKLDLTLPTEAQWELAARAGTSTVFPGGNGPESLVSLANIVTDGEPLDRWEIHAPAGALAANAFGLHDVIGNVSEWCLDPYLPRYFGATLAPGDGLAQGNGFGHRSHRGGNWGWDFRKARIAHRGDGLEGFRNSDVGVRLARALRP